LLAATAYFSVDRLLMPAYTRYGETFPMPDVRNMNIDDALARLDRLNLQPTTENVRRLKPNVPADAVVEQNPAPNVNIRAGRRSYATVTSGSTPCGVVRAVTSRSRREAASQAVNDGLQSGETPDPSPSPDRGTVTRTDPARGATLTLGDTVTVYYSTGLGN